MSTDQYVIMTQDWDPVFGNPSNQQPLRYRFKAVTGYSGPSFDPFLPWLDLDPHVNSLGLETSAYIDLLAVYANSQNDPNVRPSIQQDGNMVVRDAKGNPLYLDYACENGTCPQFCADPTNPATAASLKARAAAILEKEFTALYFDDVNPKPVTTDGSGKIVMPAGVTPYRWMEAVVQLLEDIRLSFPGVQIIHNSSYTSDTPQALIDRMIKAGDLQNIERGLQDPNLNAQTTAGIIAFWQRVHALGKRVILENYTSKLNGRDILDYLLNAFRVWMQPGDLFCVEDLITPDPRLDVDTGTPYQTVAQTGPFQYCRQFTNGWASVDINAKTGAWTPLT